MLLLEVVFNDPEVYHNCSERVPINFLSEEDFVCPHCDTVIPVEGLVKLRLDLYSEQAMLAAAKAQALHEFLYETPETKH